MSELTLRSPETVLETAKPVPLNPPPVLRGVLCHLDRCICIQNKNITAVYMSNQPPSLVHFANRKIARIAQAYAGKSLAYSLHDDSVY